jgi:type IV secretion system protein VirB6
MAFFLVGAVHVALMFMALKVAGTMVSGWQVFGLVPDKQRGRSNDAPRAAPAPVMAVTTPRSTNIASGNPGLAPRRVDLGTPSPALAANDTGPAGNVSRETHVFATSGGGQVVPLNPATSRTRGIGNRFRSASNTKGGAKPAMTTPPETYQ